MPTTFRRYTPEQSILLPPSARDWLPEGHLAYFISDTVDNLDLSAFYEPYEGDGRRNRPFEPRMMVKVLLYGYATGTFSSRKLAKKLHEDVAFRFLSGENFPCHRTIADFRKQHLTAFQELFVQVLWRASSYAEFAVSAQVCCGRSRRRLRITRGPAEGGEPVQKIALGELTLGQFGQRYGSGNHLLLHTQIDLDVGMGGGKLAMTEPRGDGGDVDSGMEQVHGRGMPDHMRRDARCVTGTDSGAGGKLSQGVGDARTAEPTALGVEEERSAFGASLREPGLERVFEKFRRRVLKSRLWDTRAM